jgi:hypothetical protein
MEANGLLGRMSVGSGAWPGGLEGVCGSPTAEPVDTRASATLVRARKPNHDTHLQDSELSMGVQFVRQTADSSVARIVLGGSRWNESDSS